MQKIEENFSFIEDIIVLYLYVPCGSADKESSCNAGDLGREDPLEKGKATHSSILAWRSPWTIQSQRVGHDWMTFTL